MCSGTGWFVLSSPYVHEKTDLGTIVSLCGPLADIPEEVVRLLNPAVDRLKGKGEHLGDLTIGEKIRGKMRRSLICGA